MAQGDRPGKKPFDPAKAEQMKADFIRGAKFAPMDLLGAPVDLTTMAMRGVGIPVPEKPFLGSEYLIDKYADLGEALDINYDRPTGSGMETLGRVMAGTAGLGGEAAVALAPGIGRLFAQATKTRGSGIEVKGSGAAELEAPSAELEAPSSELGSTSSEQLADLTTPELLTSWTIEPSKVNRAEVAARIKGDPEATARSNQALDDLGYGDSVPMYRVIKLTNDGEMEPESLISATLDPSKVPTNVEFLMQGKFSMTTPTEYRVVRYDVPRDRVAGYLPALSGDITQKVNKAVKKKGFGQEKVEGLETVTNPAKHAKSLLDMQDEIIADVSGLMPRILSEPGGNRRPLNMLSMEKMLPSAVASGEIKTVDDFSTAMGFGKYSVLNPFDFKGDPEAFQAAERAARQKAIDEFSDFFGLEKTAPKKEVLEGEVVGTKSKKYMKLEKELSEARTPELRAARELNMETQGVQDAFDLNAANNIDKNFEFASGGDEVRATSDEFIGGVIDEYQGARDQGFNRGDALVDAIRVKVRDYNEIYPDALDANSVLDDIAKNVNDDFGFDAALSRFREAQTNRNALEAELQTAKFKNVREAQEAATRVREEQLGIAGLSDSEKAAFYRNMGEQEQRGIAGIGIPEPKTPKPNLRLVKKAKGGPVDMRSGVGDLFRVYS